MIIQMRIFRPDTLRNLLCCFFLLLCLSRILCISSFYISAIKKARYEKYQALTYLSIGFYSDFLRDCNKKSPFPEGEEALHLKFFFQFFFDEPLFFFWNI